jgi:tRNA-dihydrouridine synthase
VQGAGRGLCGQRDGDLAADLWNSLKTSRRANHDGEPGPIAVQIAGTDAAMMAEAAVYNIDRGAQIIDINMGCPAKKVCNKWAGSALMQDEALAVDHRRGRGRGLRAATTCPSR